MIQRNYYNINLGDKLKLLEAKIESLEAKQDFMNDRINIVLDEKLKEKFNEKNFQAFIFGTTTRIIKNKYEEFIMAVIDKVIHKQKKLINTQLKYTQSVCLSIDEDIKHAIRNLDVSYTTEKYLKERIFNLLNEVDKKYLLNAKTIKSLGDD